MGILPQEAEYWNDIGHASALCVLLLLSGKGTHARNRTERTGDADRMEREHPCGREPSAGKRTDEAD